MLGLPHHKLITDVAVRWNSAHEMLARFLEQQPALCAALLSPVVRKSTTDICTLNETDISNTEQVVQAVKPMLVATNIMCEEKSPTISIIAPLHAQLLSDTTSTTEDSSLVREIKTTIHQDLSKRYDSVEQKNILHISSALDPRFKSLQFLLPQNVQDTYARLMEMAAALKEDADDESQVSPTPTEDKEGSTEQQAPETSAHTPKKKRKSALADLLRQTFKTTHHRLSASSIAETEVKQYLDAPPLPLTDDPLHWLEISCSSLPTPCQAGPKTSVCPRDQCTCGTCLFYCR
ncbi:hypothetical protein GJAV_G00216060 [Gymnothorax javanicus]|nr:hypothetical protein GJAV_G00216060 [Gymnothorax javanicus]